MTADSPASSRPSSRRPKSTKIEQWDENDFDFSRQTQLVTPISLTGARGGPTSRNGMQGISVPRKTSPTDSFLADWDDSPPREGLPAPSHQRSHSCSTGGPDTGMPRHSPSRTSLLRTPVPTSSPLPSSASSLMTPSPFVSHSPWPDEASGETIKESKLKKRNPSATFLPLPDEPPSSSRTTQRLPRKTSREQMPPPSQSYSLFRRSTKGKDKEVQAGWAGKFVDPFSSDKTDDGEVSRGSRKQTSNRNSMMPLSQPPSDDETAIASRRHRSASVGGSRSPTKPRPSAPPVPPMPGTLRSASTASEASTASRESGISDSGRKISLALRRSLSSLSKRSTKSSRKPSTTSLSTPMDNPALPLDVAVTAQRQSSVSSTSSSTSYPISRGFHVPSPSLNSPYHQLTPAIPKRPSLPHSHSVPVQMADNDRHNDDKSDIDATPRKPRKPRPLSIQPAPHPSSRAYDGQGWQGFGTMKPASPTSLHHASSTGQRYPFSTSSKPTTPKDSASAFWSGTAGRIERSVSKHSRRLSDTFKSATMSASNTEDPRSRSHFLETVRGSPTKPGIYKSKDPAQSAHEITSNSDAVDFGSTSALIGTGSASSAVLDSSPKASATIRADKPKRSSKRLKIPPRIARAQAQFAAEQEALAEFYRGTGTLVQLTEEIKEVYERLRKIQSTGTAELEDLLRNHELLNKRATAIIDWSNTGQTPGTEPDVTMFQSPQRNRRISLASDSAAAHAEALSFFFANDGRDGANRSISLPEPDVANIAPQADIPGPDRATTGRRSSPKKRMTIYEALGDVKPVRPGLLRGSSAVSTPSTHGATLASARGIISPSSDIASPETPDGGYFAPKAYPTSANSAPFGQQPQDKPRRSKSGLGAFVLYLRSLRVPQSPKPSKAYRSGVHSRPTPSSSVQASPAISPALSNSSAFEPLPLPARSTFSDMEASLLPPPMASAKKARRRSKMPKFFRTTSGNWTELTQTPAPPPLLPDTLMKESGQDGLLRQSSWDVSIKSNLDHGAYIGLGLPVKTTSSISISSDDSSSWGEHTATQPATSLAERTLRAHKSRLGGLGRPYSPSSPASTPPSRKTIPVSTTSTERVTSGTSDWSVVSDDSFLTAGSGAIGKTASMGIPRYDGSMRFVRDTEIMAFGIEEVEHLLKEQRELLKEMRAWKRMGEEISGAGV